MTLGTFASAMAALGGLLLAALALPAPHWLALDRLSDAGPMELF